MANKRYSYQGKGSTAGFYPSGFVLVPKFKKFLTEVLTKHREQDISVTIRIKPPRKAKPVIVKFKNGKPYIKRS